MLYGIDSEWHYIIRCFFALQSPIMPHLSKVCTPNFTMELDVTRVFIGRSRGGAGARPPLQDSILSFSHTFSLKSAHVGGQNPPQNGSTPPPTENPGSGPGIVNIFIYYFSLANFMLNYILKIILVSEC